MANLPTTMEYFDNLLGEQLTDGGGGGGGSWTVLTEESVTTSSQGSFIIANLSYSQPIDAETIKVTFNGTEYECQRMTTLGGYEYGAPLDKTTNQFDWSEYPFYIGSVENISGLANKLLTESAGTYNIKIEAPQSGGSSDFSTATVTVTSNASSEAVCYMARVEEALPAPHARTQGSSPITNGQTLVFTAILYKGYCSLRVTGANAISGTGDVTVTGKTAEVTGDCTITVS